MIKENKIFVTRTAHYASYGEINPKTQCLTMICHGYGQLGRNIIRKFRDFDQEKHFVVAPDGLSNFYWEGKTREPVASWMTKENRLDEIRDLSDYLSALYNLYYSQEKFDKRVLMGFSQGGTTVWRWIHRNRPDFDVFINWSGWIPEDIDLSILSDYLKNKKLLFVIGDADQYITEERYQMMQEIIEKNSLKIEIIKYSGGHKIHTDLLGDIYDKYINSLSSTTL